MATADLARPALGGRQAHPRTPVDHSTGVLGCSARWGYDAPMRNAIRLLAPLALALLLGACGSTPTGSPTSPPAVSAAPTAAPGRTPKASSTLAEPTRVPGGDTSAPQPIPTTVGTTQTTWGRILDAVPSTFPVFPDATVADTPAQAVSGAWVSKASASEVATWYHDALLAANFAQVDLGSPLEDGSRVLDVQGDLPECKAQVTVRPAGGSTMITVLYGAGCAGGSG